MLTKRLQTQKGDILWSKIVLKNLIIIIKGSWVIFNKRLEEKETIGKRIQNK